MQNVGNISGGMASGHMSAMVASPDASADQVWYPDSGATDHCTPDENHLLNKMNYQGKDKIYVGNGAGLSISSTGSNSFYANKHTLVLKNILHIPRITKNLLSVSKFVKDNDVLIEFHPNVCLVKDRSSKKVLLQGALKKGLYEFGLPLKTTNGSRPTNDQSTHGNYSCLSSVHSFKSNKCVNSLVNTATEDTTSVLHMWHKRLGHPSSQIVKSVMNQCQISFDFHNKLLCHACQVSKSHKLPF